MAIPLQKTKLFVPPTLSQLVDRPRLLERLDGMLSGGRRAALISAPAGSGKTSLLVQWLKRLNGTVGWLSLDSRDNLPPRFFAYLIAALKTAMPGADHETFGEALALLDLPNVNPDEIVTLLVNDLVETSGPLILVLEDFHTITHPLLHKALNLLIEAQPTQMRLVLLTREDPVIPLARLRARGQLVELRQEDLRFTPAEAVAFLNQTMGLSLTTAQAAALEARTEGWIAGLQMAALSLQRAPDAERFLQDFSGSHRFILDYLVEEVLAHQTPEVQDFLLETSILERMSAAVCAAVTGRTVAAAQELLDQLTKANLFVIPLDEERHWFRYHHLFHDLLSSRLRTENPTRTAALERRASDWFDANGEPRLAVEYALKAQDHQRAADIISQSIAERWQTVDLEFHLLLERLPVEVIYARPGLCLQYAWLGVLFGQSERILPFVEAAERRLNEPGRASEPGDAAQRAFARLLRAYQTDLDNQPVELEDSLHLSYAAIPESNVGMRNSVAVVVGTIYYMEGDFETAMRYFEEALALDKRVNGTNAVPITTVRMALALQAQGRLQEAFRRLSQSETYIRERGSRRFYISGAINLLLGDIYLEWNRLDEAEAQIREGLRLLEDWPIPQVCGLGWSLLARLHLARNDRAAAQAALDRAGALQQRRFHPIFADAVERARVRLLVTGQEPAALEAWAREQETSLQPTTQTEIHFRFESRWIDLCRVWLALGRKEEAAGLLERLAVAAQGRNGSRIAILALLAAARSHDPASALAPWAEALHLARAEGYQRTFLEVGEALQPVLTLWLKQHRENAEDELYQYAYQVWSALDPVAPAIPIPARPPVNLVEMLSRREMEVLQMVAQGLTNQQIADRLVISVRTVKKHIENLNGKLAAQNRTQAVARARELRLLD